MPPPPASDVAGIFFVLLVVLSVVGATSNDAPAFFGGLGDRGKGILGGENLGTWEKGLLKLASGAQGPVAMAPDSKYPLVLAGNRTKRPDVLNKFRLYRGGWDITNKHYWASVAFTGIAGFLLALLWFISFAFAFIYSCCIRRKTKSDISFSKKCIYLILLFLFTCAASSGCILLSVGQAHFRNDLLHTLNFVVNQSDFTVQILTNVTGFLSFSETVSVEKVHLPVDVQYKIDKLNVDLNEVAGKLSEGTKQNSGRIRGVIGVVRCLLVVVASLMALLAVLGFCNFIFYLITFIITFIFFLFLYLSCRLSFPRLILLTCSFAVFTVLGHKHSIYIFAASGWLLVVFTLILCGIFKVINSATVDTCIAMNEWVQNPQAQTALSSILPCVNEETTNRTLYQSKYVTYQLVNIINTVIASTVNSDIISQDKNSSSYNHSGPSVPYLCYPYDYQLHDQQCNFWEVTLENALQVWQNYTCEVSDAGSCVSIGRLTPDVYNQLATAVNVSYALYHYSPLLLNLQNCNFVRETFSSITAKYCPNIDHDLQMVTIGLALISVGVLLCLSLWVLYANCPKKGEDACGAT